MSVFMSDGKVFWTYSVGGRGTGYGVVKLWSVDRVL